MIGLVPSLRLMLYVVCAGVLFSGELRFEPNLGQFGKLARFAIRTERGAVLFTEAGFQIDGDAPVVFTGASKHPPITGEEAVAAKLNYFAGNDPRKWLANVETYRSIRYHEPWPGIDVVFHASGANLEYDFVVHPGYDPAAVRIGFEVHPVLNRQGDLIVATAHHLKPHAYQEMDGVRRNVPASFRVRGEEVGLDVGAYDRSAALVIDPVLVYSTFLAIEPPSHLTGPDPQAAGIAADAQGAAYVTGYTYSPSFATAPGRLSEM